MVKVRVTKEEADKLMNIKGNVTSSILKAGYQFILHEKGEKGIKTVEQRLKELGYPLGFKEISSFRWYPISQACLFYLAALDVFDWDESKAFDIGYNTPLYSILTKLLYRYFSLERMLREVPRYWLEHFDIGEVECVESNKNKRCAILRIKNFKKFHPILYIYMKGYITRVHEMAIKKKAVKVEQTKCIYNNDPYDEFKITW